MTDKKRKSLFDRLKQGLEEGIAHAKGELTLKTTEVPIEPPDIDAETLAELRRQAAMSQVVFARMLSVSRKTVQSWEQGVREPSESNRRLIHIFTMNPEVICRTVGLPEVKLEGVEIEDVPGGRRKIVIRKRRKKQPV